MVSSLILDSLLVLATEESLTDVALVLLELNVYIVIVDAADTYYVSRPVFLDNDIHFE